MLGISFLISEWYCRIYFEVRERDGELRRFATDDRFTRMTRMTRKRQMARQPFGIRVPGPHPRNKKTLLLLSLLRCLCFSLLLQYPALSVSSASSVWKAIRVKANFP